MKTPMKPPKPELQNSRILRLANRFLSFPFISGIACYGRLTRFFKSDEQLRAQDQVRQSRIRRELRGLPRDHVAQSAKQ